MKTIRVLAAASAAGATVLALASPASAAAFNGNIQATLVGTMTTSAGNCTGSVLTGSLASGSPSNPLTINSATFSGCAATVTAQNLSWTGGINGGTATINGFKIKVVATLGITCYYAGNLTATARNSTSTAEAQIELVNASASKQSGSSFLCPGTATVSAVYNVKGESSPGSGVYNQKINLF
ncbi:hypothetical protein [Actinocorallia libanotica]|uniref:Spore coat protein U-like protein n=1 Tax=Actinocorallia libanotica TaxID=46162 RepID=A0ABN1QLF0_9ACTN